MLLCIVVRLCVHMIRISRIGVSIFFDNRLKWQYFFMCNNKMFSPQAILLVVVYILIIIIATVSAIQKQGASYILGLNVVLSVALTILLAYDTACLTSGNCGIWSWVRTVLYILIPIIGIIIWIVSLLRNNKSNTTLIDESLPFRVTVENKKN